MKTIDLAGTTPKLQDLLDLASEENVILRTAAGKEYVLAELDEFDREIALVRQNQELMGFLDSRSQPSRTHSLEQAKQALGLD
jgi:hypothetical protein